MVITLFLPAPSLSLFIVCHSSCAAEAPESPTVRKMSCPSEHCVVAYAPPMMVAEEVAINHPWHKWGKQGKELG